MCENVSEQEKDFSIRISTSRKVKKKRNLDVLNDSSSLSLQPSVFFFVFATFYSKSLWLCHKLSLILKDIQSVFFFLPLFSTIYELNLIHASVIPKRGVLVFYFPPTWLHAVGVPTLRSVPLSWPPVKLCEGGKTQSAEFPAQHRNIHTFEKKGGS